MKHDDRSQRSSQARGTVFISSTYLDNVKRRKIVEDAVLSAEMVPIGMERFTATTEPTVDECLRMAAEADVLVCIVGWRYGWVPAGHDKSITELEWEANPERLSFLLHDSVDVNPARDLDQDPDGYARVCGFRRRIQGSDAMPGMFTDEVLGTRVITALQGWLKGRDRRVHAPSASAVVSVTEPADREAEIANYLRSAESAYDHVALAGFETRVRVPIRLEDLHVPLDAIVDTRAFGDGGFQNAEEAEAMLDRGAREDSRIPLTEAFVRASALGGRRGLVILGDPGSGKTTHLKRLLLWLVREKPESIGLPQAMVPVFLQLRNLRDLDGGLDAFLEAELASPHLSLAEGFGRRLLERGNLLFLLDGLDEVPGLSDRGRVARWIEQAMNAHPQSQFVVTCRYAGYTGPAQLDGRLLELHLRPLTAEQATSFVRNWYRIVETSLATDKDQARVHADERATALVARLAEPDFRARRVFELTRNPLLLTAICLVHRDRGVLPRRRGSLYDECINVLLERWRDAKQLAVTMDADAARRVLQPVASWLHGQEERTRATADELIPVIEPELARVKAPVASARSFLETVRDESGLLTGWSGDQYGFMHLGFQEYLTARRIKDLAFDRPEVLEELARSFGSSWWREVSLLLLALEGPPIFERFMRLVTREPGFAKDPELVEECLDDAVEVGMAPFVELLGEDPGVDPERWARQLAALRVLERHAPEELGPLADGLRRHPLADIAERFGAPAPAVEMRVADRGGYELVRIPGGRFLMGSPESEKGRFEREGPQHEVELDGFYLGRCPVTNEEYGRYLAENPGASEPAEWGNRKLNQPQQPVVGVSWEDAKAYCDWAGLVLPTEAQWEYACRGGTRSRYWSGDSEEDLSRVGWYEGNSGGRLHAVGEKPPNAFGLHDMHGNVWEWCQDWYGSYEMPVRGDSGLREALGGSYRVSRGGSFAIHARHARSAYRSNDHPGDRWDDLGFRPACAYP